MLSAMELQMCFPYWRSIRMLNMSITEITKSEAAFRFFFPYCVLYAFVRQTASLCKESDQDFFGLFLADLALRNGKKDISVS